MSRISRIIVMEDNQLFVLAALDNLRTTSVQLRLDLVDNRENEWSQEGEYEDVDLLFKLLNKIRKNGNLLNSFGDRLHELVVPFDDWIDFLRRLLHLSGKGFRLTGRDSHLRHLSRGSIGLKLICLSSLVLASE